MSQFEMGPGVKLGEIDMYTVTSTTLQEHDHYTENSLSDPTVLVK